MAKKLKNLILLLLFSLLFPIKSFATDWSVDSDALGIWLFDETSGNANDETVNNNDGTVTGVTYGATGKFGTAYNFDTDGDNVNFASGATLDNAQPFTCVFWIQIDTEGTNDGFVGKNFSTSGYWRIEIISTSTNTIQFRKETTDPDLVEYWATCSQVGFSKNDFILPSGSVITSP